MRLNCQQCKFCKVDNDCHKSYLYCDKGCHSIDKDISVALKCESFAKKEASE